MEFLQSPAGIAVVVVALLAIVGVLVALTRRKPGWEDALEGEQPGTLTLPPSPPKPAKAPATKPPPARAAPAKAAPAEAGSVFGRLVHGLARTKAQMVNRVDDLFRGRKQIDEDLWTSLEELLVTSDVGIRTTGALLQSMRDRAAREELADPQRLRDLLAETIRESLDACAGALAAAPLDGGPLVIVVVGVNGAGKTTTIGKLAARYKAEGKKVIIAAGDTFRAAAIEQVAVWGKRAGAEVVRHEAGSDPAAVAHDAVTAAVARGADVVICDTAGRLHSKTDLMQELGKVHRVVGKVRDGAPHEVLLVLDSTNGQNAIAQAREFASAVGVTGIVLTKLDGTAKGGVIVGIAHELDIPVKLIGIGEAVEDLRDFEPEAFVRALFGGDTSALGRGGNSADAAARDAELGIASEDLADTSARYQG
jgi:fused signal recognition particle receptor